MSLGPLKGVFFRRAKTSPLDGGEVRLVGSSVMVEAALSFVLMMGGGFCFALEENESLVVGVAGNTLIDE